MIRSWAASTQEAIITIRTENDVEETEKRQKNHEDYRPGKQIIFVFFLSVHPKLQSTVVGPFCLLLCIIVGWLFFSAVCVVLARP